MRRQVGSARDIGERNGAREPGDQFMLRPQLQMQIEQYNEADAHPHVEDEVDAAPDPSQFCDPRAVRGKPHEV
jgi:hypothetical protein